MSSAILCEESEAPPRAARSDSLAQGVVMLLVMTVVQRLAGFVRGMLFCRWLDPEELGQWDVAFGFLTLAAPLAVLGLPGSYGRYAEHFRQRGQLRLFLRRTTLASSLMGLVAVAAVAVFREEFSQFIFGSPDQAELVAWIAAALAALVVHNSLASLFIAVKRYRAVSSLQFLQSFLFAVIAILLLVAWQCSSVSAVAAFCLATLISVGATSIGLFRIWREAPESAEPAPQRAFWARLAPFAVWVWVTNLLANLFDVIDRYMLIHYSGLDMDEALRQVGYYHSSRIIPLLFVAVTDLISCLAMPHLTHDWETGRRESVAARVNVMLKAMSLAMFTGAIGVLWIAPTFFDVAFQSKLTGGLAVLPWTLTYCTWFGLVGVAQNYLWCAEKARISTLAFFCGLMLNIGLNVPLVHHYGLHGAVWSTTAANLLVLVLMFVFSTVAGMRIDRGTWLLSLSPLALGLGPAIASSVLAAILVAIFASNYVLSAAEKDEILVALGGYTARIKQLFLSTPGRRRVGETQTTEDPIHA